jgi:Protein of unknown function (DUF1761)
MKFHLYIPFLTALIPILVGFIWYNPKTFGPAWMKAADMTEEKSKGGNLALIFGLTYLFSLFMSFILISMVIHQVHLLSLFQNEAGAQDPNSEVGTLLTNLFDKYGSNFRTFKHGVFHGILVSLFFVMPVMAINALFERKGFKYIAINSAYWMLSIALMGGVISCCF